jgi:pleiotropic regulator 1
MCRISQGGRTGTRLITCEADKSIKMWKEDSSATPESHPVEFQKAKKRERY